MPIIRGGVSRGNISNHNEMFDQKERQENNIKLWPIVETL